MIRALALFSVLAVGLTQAYAAPATITFSHACDPGQKFIISGIGDVLPHEPLAEQAYASPLAFKSLWYKMIPWFSAADISYGNLEGPAAEGVAGHGQDVPDPGPHYDGFVYTGSNLNFNYNPEIVRNLADSGFAVMSVGNNHAMDRGGLGLDRTIQAFDQAGLAYIGAHPSSDLNADWGKIIEKNGWRIAFIACSEFLNNPRLDTKHQVLLCYRDEPKILAEIRRLSQDSSIDAVVVAPHWGVEYHPSANASQRKVAREYLDAGASAIIGSHPHVMQEMEKYVTSDGRETVIAYSLGNFVSFQGLHPEQKLGAILYVGLTKRAGAKAWINGISYLPTWVDRGPSTVNALELTRQAPQAQVRQILQSVFDPSRELHAKEAVRTDLDCP